MGRKPGSKKKNSMMQISNYVVRDGKLSPCDFVMYVCLKQLTTTRKTSTVEMYRIDLMSKLKIVDKRTLNKSIENLIEYGVISNYTGTSTNGIIRFDVNTGMFECGSNFTQLPTELLTFLPKIGHIGFRLLYYYESFINRTIGEEHMFCFVGYKKTASDLHISEPSITKYNNILKEQRLLRVVKHKIGTGATVVDESLVEFGRYNNHYTPLRANMVSQE